MTAEGLENLKKIIRNAIGLQIDAALVMAALQSIHCDEGDGLEQDMEKYLRSAIVSARRVLNYAISTTNNVQKAYGIEKDLVWLEDQLGNGQCNGTARTE